MSTTNERPARFADFMASLLSPEVALIDQNGPTHFTAREWESWQLARPLLEEDTPEWEALPLDKVARHRLKQRIAALLDELDIESRQQKLEALLARTDYATNTTDILAQVRNWVQRPLALQDPRALQAVVWKLRVAVMNRAELTLQHELMRKSEALSRTLEALAPAEQVLYSFWQNPWQADVATPESLLHDERLSAGLRFDLGRMLMLHYHPRRMLQDAARMAQFLYDGVCNGQFYSPGNLVRVLKYHEFLRFELFQDTTLLMRDLLKDTTGQLLHYRLNQVLRCLGLRRFDGVAEVLAATEAEAQTREEMYVMHKLIRTEYYILTGNLAAAENLNNILYLDKGNLFFKSTGDKLINQRLRIYLLSGRHEETVALFHRKKVQDLIGPMLSTNRYFYLPLVAEQCARCHLEPNTQAARVEALLQKFEGFLPDVNFHSYRNLFDAAELLGTTVPLSAQHRHRLAELLAPVKAKLDSVPTPKWV